MNSLLEKRFLQRCEPRSTGLTDLLVLIARRADQYRQQPTDLGARLTDSEVWMHAEADVLSDPGCAAKCEPV